VAWKKTFLLLKVAEVSELWAGCGEPSCPTNPRGEDGGEGASQSFQQVTLGCICSAPPGTSGGVKLGHAD